jgi:hypothetical protein
MMPQTARTQMDHKRPRPTSPTPHKNSPEAVASLGAFDNNNNNNNIISSTWLAQRLRHGSSDDTTTGTRIQVLNDLLRITVSREITYTLDGDALLQALAAIYYQVIGWEDEPRVEDYDDDDDDSSIIINDVEIVASLAWGQHLTPLTARWA